MKINLAGIQISSGFKAQELELAELKAKINAIDKAQAVIEFNLDGTIITANTNFLSVMGYTLDEVIGRHHSIFVDPIYKASHEYLMFWDKLNRGEYESAEYKRIGKGGKEVWIQASYNPILDDNGKPYKVVKFATDVSQSKMDNANFEGQIDAISKAQAVIEFNMDGTIITANDNFLGAVGYTLDEVAGKHHSIFVEPAFKASNEYREFWEKLNRGEYETAEYKRIGKGGKEIWIQASYNPILDMNGKPFKVVKFASDVTQAKLSNADFEGQIEAISKAQAVIEFNMDGSIITANENFLGAVGYTLDEVAGKHHSIFVEPAYKASNEYHEFWAKLNRGEFETAQYKRIGKGGKEIWIQASYNPILDMNGKPFKVVKFASDVTQSKLSNADFQGQIDAIGKAQAVIEFNMDGTIITANDNFLGAVGYTLDEVAGKHHSIFVEPEFKASNEYREFWAKLNRGEYETAEYKRIGKGGKEIWIQASYNPILDMNGKPFKVVKFASDVTQRKLSNADFEGQIEAISKAQAVIEFNMDGTIITANENFLGAVGYTLEEVQGKHHSIFVETAFKESYEYREFWEKLNRGEYETAQYKRIGKGGKEIWIQASYNPILDLNGKPFKVVKFASDVTQNKLSNANFEGQIDAISKAQAVIEFNMDGTIITANDNFLGALGYTLEEIRGKHHSIFVEPQFKSSNEYQAFWEKLNRGEYEAAEYLRLGKGGNEIWIQASYNPILDLNGKPIKVVKFASDITAQKLEAVENKKIADVSSALKLCDANVMLADNDLNIVYMNNGIEKMLRGNQNQIREELLNFNVDTLIGSCVDIFHKNPAHQRGKISSLDKTSSTQIEIAGLTIKLTLSPWMNTDNERIGTVVEMRDRTEEVFIEKEIATLISSAGEGNLTTRIREEGKSGFFLNLAGGLNQLVGIAEGVIDETAAMLDAMAHGDLTKRIESEYKGAFDKLKTDANATAVKLTEVISRINNSSSAVASGAEEIAQGNTDLSQRTEEQASSLEETASSMEQMTSTVRQNADNAKVANDLAADATIKAQKGGDVVRRAVSSMSEINDSSKKIADIIGVIDEIAFQTNLLALNAAVEAARAGEQGRGFAVVAGEVRNLAQRSAAAAKEIKDLIRDSVSKVQDGSQLVNESGATLSEIVDAISRVTAMIADISNASSEQSEGIEQVNKAITQMDEMTQQNAALVEEASAAGEAMADQARGMRQILGFFTTGGNGSASMSAESPMLMSPKSGNGNVPTAPVKKAPTAESSNNMDFTDDDEEWEEF
jgi:methyl-accepting chemotaxis protein